MKYTLSKKLVNKIIKDELNENNIKIKIFPIDNIEYILRVIKKDIKEKDEFVKYGVQLDEIIALTSNCYKKHHDEFYIEILANNYSIERTIEFMKKHPNVYQQLQYNIDLTKIYYQIYLQNYDPQQQINYISKIIKKKDKKIVNMYFKEIDTLSKLFTKEGVSKPQTYLPTEDFYINYIIASSKACLDKINYNDCEHGVLKILLKSLNYTYDIEITRYQANEQLKELIIERDKNLNEKIKMENFI